MSNLIKSLRVFSAVKQSAGYMGAMQRRLESTKPPFPAPAADSLKQPLQKAQEDPLADPKESYLADPWDVLYGAEKFEIAMRHKGITDPYDMEPVKRKAVSSAADPNIVPTLDNMRVVGCICEADTHHINFMWINKGETARCECGHWFKCVERELPDLSEFGIHYDKHAH